MLKNKIIKINENNNELNKTINKLNLELEEKRLESFSIDPN
jgi:hypothetical protein